MRKRLIMCIGVLCLVMFGMSAGGIQENVVSENEKTIPELTGPVTIELWSSLSGSKAKVFDAQVKDFNGKQNQVSVNVIHQGGYSILRQKISAAANAKNMPDLLICDYLDVAYYAQLGLLRDLDGVIDQKIMDDYYPAMLADLTYKGKVYALPYNRSTQGFFVNTDLMEQAGIDKVPETWDEFKEDCEAMKKLGDDFYFGYAFFHQFLFDAIAYTWGAQVATSDGTVCLTDPEMVEMFTYFQDLYQKNLLLMQPVLVGGFEEQNGAFLNGKVASVFQTSSFIPTAQNLLPYNWRFAMIPAGKGGHAVTIGGGNFAICSQVEGQRLAGAKVFLEYMSSPEIVSDFFTKTGNLPTRQSVFKTEKVKTFLATNPAYQTVVDQLAYGKAAPSTTKNIRDVFNRVNEMISRIILGGEDVKKVLAEYQEVFQTEFDEAKAGGEFIY